MHLGQLHRRVFNFIRCWSLKMAKRFSIAYNCKKTKQNKTRNENGYAKKKKQTNKKKMRETKLDRKKIN